MFGMPSGWEWLIILALGLLLFGRRLPEVGRSLGRSIVEFKKGIKGIEDEVESVSDPRRFEGPAKPALSGNGAKVSSPAGEPEPRRVSTSDRVGDGT